MRNYRIFREPSTRTKFDATRTHDVESFRISPNFRCHGKVTSCGTATEELSNVVRSSKNKTKSPRGASHRVINIFSIARISSLGSQVIFKYRSLSPERGDMTGDARSRLSDSLNCCLTRGSLSFSLPFTPTMPVVST